MKKIKSIDENGKVLFEDTKGVGVVGTKQDCLAYGYNYTGSACYIQKNNKAINKKGNVSLDKSNKVNGVNNNVIGKGNFIQANNVVALGNSHIANFSADNSTLIGRNAFAENYGEVALSSAIIPNRAKFSFLQFDGTTTNNTATEIYLGGKDGYRFFINENYESGFAIDYTAVAINPSSNDIFTSYGHATYKFTNNTLTEVGHEKSTTIRDSSTNHYDIDFAPISATTDYIECKVTGDTGHTVYWTVDLKVTEVRYA
jgi:hypothetical protein